jgi:hypothetical protein
MQTYIRTGKITEIYEKLEEYDRVEDTGNI